MISLIAYTHCIIVGTMDMNVYQMLLELIIKKGKMNKNKALTFSFINH